MHRVEFRAYGHENVIGDHRTTVEITTEDFLTPQGTCIIGIRSELTLKSLDDEIKELARFETTKIILRITAGGLSDEVVGRGSPGLTYKDDTSMVARTSIFECERTLMVEANKAASDINRHLITELQKPSIPIDCELIFFTQ